MLCGLILPHAQLILTIRHLISPGWLQPHYTPDVAHVHSWQDPLSYACQCKQLLFVQAVISL